MPVLRQAATNTLHAALRTPRDLPRGSSYAQQGGANRGAAVEACVQGTYGLTPTRQQGER